MKRHQPKKSLGQNWLKDSEVLEKIIKAAKLTESDNVLEIGPGKGALTRELVGNAGKVIAIEKDEQLADGLSQEISLNPPFLKGESLEIIKDDILEINLPELIEQNDFQDYKVVANIPYYITGKILRLLFETKHTPKVIVLLVQKEVAERICSKPGNMSILAVSVQYFGKPKIIDYVSKESFDPVPKVDSAIIKIIPNNPSQSPLKLRGEAKEFFRLVKIGFAFPRKTLANNLSSGFQKDKEEIRKALEEAEVEENARAEDLSVEDWKRLGHIKL